MKCILPLLNSFSITCLARTWGIIARQLDESNINIYIFSNLKNDCQGKAKCVIV